MRYSRVPKAKQPSHLSSDEPQAHHVRGKATGTKLVGRVRGRLRPEEDVLIRWLPPRGQTWARQPRFRLSQGPAPNLAATEPHLRLYALSRLESLLSRPAPSRSLPPRLRPVRPLDSDDDDDDSAPLDSD